MLDNVVFDGGFHDGAKQTTAGRSIIETSA